VARAVSGDGDATLTILGSGTLLPDASRHGAAHLVETGPLRLLLDCGWGTLDGLARHGAAWADLTHLAVTHFHADHVGDLSALLLALRHGITPPREDPLTLLGPVGLGAFLERLAEATGTHVTDPGFPVRVVELGAENVFEDPARALRVTCHPTPHTAESVAYRVEVGGATLGYTGDTGPSEDVAAFLTGCDVLIAECTQVDPSALPSHLSPATLGALARTARPRILVVTHVAPPMTPASAAAAVARQWDGTVLPGADGLAIPLR